MGAGDTDRSPGDFVPTGDISSLPYRSAFPCGMPALTFTNLRAMPL